MSLSLVAIAAPPGSALERRGAEHGLFLRPDLDALCTTRVLSWVFWVLFWDFWILFWLDSTCNPGIPGNITLTKISLQRGGFFLASFLKLDWEDRLQGPSTAHPITSVALLAQGSGALRQPSNYEMCSKILLFLLFLIKSNWESGNVCLFLVMNALHISLNLSTWEIHQEK